MGLGSVLVEPCVHIKVCEDGKSGEVETIKLGNGIPFRSLTYPPIQKDTAPRKNPMFYAGRQNLPMRTQEEILELQGFPEENNMPKNYRVKLFPTSK